MMPTMPMQALNALTKTTFRTIDEPLMGKMALYRNSKGERHISFVLPNSAILDPTGGVVIERMAPDMWIMRSDPNVSHPRPSRNGNITKIDIKRPESLFEGLEPFGRSPAEYRRIGDKVEVRLLTTQVRSIDARKSAVERGKKKTPQPVIEDHLPAQQIANDAGTAIADVAHQALDLVRRVERESVYRLTKVKDDTASEGYRWMFKAPVLE